jgi:hypothetical protein
MLKLDNLLLLILLKVFILTSFIFLQTLKGGLTSRANTYIISLKNNKAIITIAVAVFASMFFCSLSLSDLVSAYGSLRGGGGLAGGAGGGEGGGESRSSGLGGSPGGGANIPTSPSSPITTGEGRLSGPSGSPSGGASFPITPNNPNSPITSGRTADNSGSGPVGPHGPYGPGPVGPREPNNIDDNTITNNKIYAPRNLEGPVIVNPQPAPTTTETPSQTDITVAPTTTEEEQQQETNDDDDGGESTSAEAQNQIPIANAGPSLTVQPSSNVVLDGTKSSDSNGDPLQFLWLQLAGGPTVPLLKNTTASPSFTAPSVSNTTVLTFQLIVSDGQTDSMPAYTYVTLQP